MASYDLAGKVAFVTGAARGIGLETARALHRRGAAVALVDLDAAAATAAAAGIDSERAIGLAADVTDPDALDAAVTATVERFGGLDVCVANAGVAPAAATVRVMSPETFERVIEVNLLGVYRTVYSCLPQIVARRGHVALVASVDAFLPGVFIAPYGASKAGVEQLGRALRAELQIHGASASVVYFGLIDTDMVRSGFDEDPLAQRFVHRLPRFMRHRLAPAAAGEAIARGIERRAPRIFAPRYYAVLSALRGLINPLIDKGIERDAELSQLLREVDAEGRVSGREIVARPVVKSGEPS